MFLCNNWNMCLLFNHRGGYGNIESSHCIQEQEMHVSHLPQPMPDATHGVLLLVARHA